MSRGSPAHRAIVGLVAATVLAGCGSGHRAPVAATQPATLPFGTLAGYMWTGRVRSISASWAVPRIRAGSRGLAGTWIGLEASGPRATDPFIQVGTAAETNLRKRHPGPVYFVFWSDTRAHFAAVPLFPVKPGDVIRVSLRVTPPVVLVDAADVTGQETTEFRVGDEAGARFTIAEWNQEDPVAHGTQKPVPYPDQSEVTFRNALVNGRPLTAAAATSTWMSLPNGYLAPTPIVHAAFSVHPARLTPSGSYYVMIASDADQHAKSFDGVVHALKATTPSSRIAAGASALLRSDRNYASQLTSSAWPGAATPLIKTLLTRLRNVDRWVRLLPSIPPSGRAAWKVEWRRRAHAATAAAKRLRDSLTVPEEF